MASDGIKPRMKILPHFVKWGRKVSDASNDAVPIITSISPGEGAKPFTERIFFLPRRLVNCSYRTLPI